MPKEAFGDTTEDIDGGYYAFWGILLIIDVREYVFSHIYAIEAVERVWDVL